MNDESSYVVDYKNGWLSFVVSFVVSLVVMFIS